MPQIHQDPQQSAINQPLHILVVEDDLLFNTFYQRFLGTKSVEVSSCTSVNAAMQMFSQHQPTFDAVILDNQLSDGEGISLLPVMQQSSKEPAVIMVSGNNDPEFFLTSFAAGIDDYMVKPVHLDLLWLKINKAVLQRRLSFLSASQQTKLEHWIEQERQQQLLAKHLFDTLFLDIHQQHPAIHVWMQPADVFSGDAVLSYQSKDGAWYFVMADAMGHGLAPAVSLMPLMQHFQMLAAKNLPLANLVFDLNAALHQLLPADRFVAAMLIRVDPWRQKLEIWNGGMPALQGFNSQGQLIFQAPSAHMALGVRSNEHISVIPQAFELSQIAYLLMFSDGLTDSTISTGQLLARQQIISYIKLNDVQPLQWLQQLFEETKAADDISVCLVDCHKLFETLPPDAKDVPVRASSINAQFCLRGAALRTEGLCQQVVEFLRAQGLPNTFLQRVFTVITELYVNALEHGVLQLDSKIKEQPEGFAQFYADKERRLHQLTEHHFIQLELYWSAIEPLLEIKLQDSGVGFMSDQHEVRESTLSYGRGFRLVRQLSQQFDLIPPGNSYRVLMMPQTSGLHPTALSTQ